MLRNCLILLLLVLPMQSLAEVQELYWEDMVPEGVEQPLNDMMIMHSGNANRSNAVAPVVEKLNGKTFKIPGFVVPLEGDDQKVTEFLLVPYFGACIHVPPPPSNQIVYVKFEKGVPIRSIRDAVWVTGVLTTKQWAGEIATVGYTMQGSKLELFDG